MATVTKKILINTISQKLGIHHNDVRNVIQAFLDQVIDLLAQKQRIELRDFGIFEVVERKEKIGRNPKDPKKPIKIPKRQSGKFTPGKKMKQLIEVDVRETTESK